MDDTSGFVKHSKKHKLLKATKDSKLWKVMIINISEGTHHIEYDIH